MIKLKLDSLSSKEVLYQKITSDIESFNVHFNIFPVHLSDILFEDLNTLIFNNMAYTFKIVFYNPVDESDIFLTKSYTFDPHRSEMREKLELSNLKLKNPYEFDIYVYFSQTFLSLTPEKRRKILKASGHSIKWFNFEDVFSEQLEQDDAPNITHKEENFYQEETVIPPEPEVKQVEHYLSKYFKGDRTLFLADYHDSRKLIEEFIHACNELCLTPIQWTFYEGFRLPADKYNERFTFNDSFCVDVKLSPLEVLRHIKTEPRRKTIYLLEDFHYYLDQEVISLIKSLPKALAQVESFLVVLAPTLELPVEIAPIFKIIKNDLTKKKFHFIERFGTDLTQMVTENRCKPVLEREGEIIECLKVLLKMEANNPLLVGKSGVGKTAIVQGLAKRIVDGNVPEIFASKKIISLNLNAMISGTKYRGEFEKRLEGLLDEVKSNSQNIIIFIDEIHALLGMGGTEGSTGAENILKPALARGEFPCIGATTYLEYAQYIEPDQALNRRFQVIDICEPDVEQTIRILKGIKSIFENHHKLRISDQALVKCVQLSDNSFKDQYFPGKAIKMIDSICASAFLGGEKNISPEFIVNEFDKITQARN